MEEATWKNALLRSYNSNRAIDYCLNISVGVIQDGFPVLHCVRFKKFTDNMGLVFHIDLRSELAHSLENAMFMWYFPLTTELYKLGKNSIEVFRDNEGLRTSEWNNLGQNDKVGYYFLPPDVPKLEEKDRLNYDIDHYNPQDAHSISPNFAVLVVRPGLVDFTKYIDKKAIGNSRKTFESLPQPDANSRRWIHTFENNQWTIQEINIPHRAII